VAPGSRPESVCHWRQIDDPGSSANLAIKLAFKNSATSFDYYVQYVRPRGWNRGLGTGFVFVRRIGPGKDIGPTPAILGMIMVPGATGMRTQMVEPSGNILFQVERLDSEGRTVQIYAGRNLSSQLDRQPPSHAVWQRSATKWTILCFLEVCNRATDVTELLGTHFIIKPRRPDDGGNSNEEDDTGGDDGNDQVGSADSAEISRRLGLDQVSIWLLRTTSCALCHSK
jgi:hypothetical protein